LRRSLSDVDTVVAFVAVAEGERVRNSKRRRGVDGRDVVRRGRRRQVERSGPVIFGHDELSLKYGGDHGVTELNLVQGASLDAVGPVVFLQSMLQNFFITFVNVEWAE
jgi:hypothetical protein